MLCGTKLRTPKQLAEMNCCVDEMGEELSPALQFPLRLNIRLGNEHRIKVFQMAETLKCPGNWSFLQEHENSPAELVMVIRFPPSSAPGHSYQDLNLKWHFCVDLISHRDNVGIRAVIQ